LKESIDLADKLDAKRIKVRATLQLASLYAAMAQPRDAIRLAEGTLDYIKRAQLRQYEMRALDILAQAKVDVHAYPEARQLAEQLLALAGTLDDEDAKGIALEALAYQAKKLGAYPEALGYLTRVEAIRRAQRQNTSLSFALWNRADVLLQLGRFEEADAPLGEMEARIKSGVGAFVVRARRTTLLRVYSAVERRQFADVDAY